MPRKGENIYKRKDGRWEARYIYSFKEDGSPRYRSIYAADYLTVKKKQNDAKRKMDPRLFQSVRMKKNISFYGLLWLERLKPSSKESTYVRYHYLFSHYISPMIGDRLVYTFSNKDCEVFLNRLLVSGKSDGSGLAPKTVTDIRSVVKLILKTAEKEGELSLCNPELCSVKSVRKPLRILSLKEQQDLQDYLLGNLTHKNIGTLIALYTGVRLGELCAMQWKDIHFQEQYLEIDVGPRAGGNMIPDLLGLIFDVDVVEMAVLTAMGEKINNEVHDGIPFYATHNLGNNVIVDNAQAYFQDPLPGIDTLYTCRKFFGVPDGAILYTDKFIKIKQKDESYKRMNFLLGRFERTAGEFYQEYVDNNRLFKVEPIFYILKTMKVLMNYLFILIFYVFHRYLKRWSQ